MAEYDRLKTRQRAERDGWHQNLGLRVHRALSWLQRAEMCEDNDGRFVFLWVSFNAAYAQELYDLHNTGEQTKFNEFLGKLVELDEDKGLYRVIWQEFPSSIRVLLQNRYVFGPFWEYHQGRGTEVDWQQSFQKANAAASSALGAGDTGKVLGIVLSRLYVLRNQLVHGGATWDSSINRDQVRDGTAFMMKLVPVVIELMMDNSHTLWGDPAFPVTSRL